MLIAEEASQDENKPPSVAEALRSSPPTLPRALVISPGHVRTLAHPPDKTAAAMVAAAVVVGAATTATTPPTAAPTRNNRRRGCPTSRGVLPGPTPADGVHHGRVLPGQAC
jgi:hypothetical protein